MHFTFLFNVFQRFMVIDFVPLSRKDISNISSDHSFSPKMSSYWNLFSKAFVNEEIQNNTEYNKTKREGVRNPKINHLVKYWQLFVFPYITFCSRFKPLFIFQILGECHCWWTEESPVAHAAKLIRRVLRASNISVLKKDWRRNILGLLLCPFWLQLDLALFEHHFSTFKLLCLTTDHWWG